MDITQTGIGNVASDGVRKYNVYDLQGVKVLSNAGDISGVAPGIYVVNGRKQIVE